MAYKINGNVIIDDNGNVSLTNFPTVATPVNVSPSDGETDVIQNITLTLSNFKAQYTGTAPLKFAQFQVANVNTFVTANVVYDSGNAAPLSSNTIPLILTANTTFYWRGRYINNNDVYSEFSDVTSFTTKNVPSVIGQSFGGGFYTGTIDIGGGTCYYLIVAPNSTGCACCAWKTTNTDTPGATSLVDGYTITYSALNNVNHPAGNWTATRTIAGFTDWYLPATNELTILYNNKNNMPVGERYKDAFVTDNYHTSNQDSSTNSCAVRFSTGAVIANNKCVCSNVRAVRRIPV